MELIKSLFRKYLAVGIIAFVVTCYISFFLVALNTGFTKEFLAIWMRSWLIAFLLAIPSLLFVAPSIKQSLSNFKSE